MKGTRSVHLICSRQSPPAKGGGKINVITQLSSSCNKCGLVCSAENTKSAQERVVEKSW